MFAADLVGTLLGALGIADANLDAMLDIVFMPYVFIYTCVFVRLF